MGMALKEDVVKACRMDGTERPVDLAFLSAQTMGDTVLENEVLSLFAKQAEVFINTARLDKTPQDAKRTAHTIKGAARGIGAFRLADHAQQWEDDGTVDLAVLQREIDCVCVYIAELQASRK